MVKINPINLNRRRKVDLSKVSKIAGAALRALKKHNAELNIVFVSSQKIRALNRAYLGIDGSTDVIAWPAGEKLPGASRVFLGDIAISSDKAARNAKIYGVRFSEEIARYVIHGTLHLAGYDDRTSRGRQNMKAKEDEILQKTKRIL